MAKNLDNLKIDTDLNRGQVVSNLEELFQSFQELAEAEGISILDMKVSPGLLFYDVIQALELTDQEQAKILEDSYSVIKAEAEDPITILA